MKRILHLVLLGLFCSTFLFQANAQIIFSEDFDGISGPTAGGAGTYSFPEGWLLRNVDNRTPYATVAYVNQAWERREDFNMNVLDSAAFSTSWYSPVGQADDWMWTPEITLPATGNSLLKWNAVAYDPNPVFRDGYEVRIMISPNVPTGGTGVIGNQLTNSTLLFSTTLENSNWTAREVNLSSYNGQTFRIAFRNNSYDKFILLIDDVVIEQVNDFDLHLTEYSPFEYTKIPLSQADDIPLGAKVMNLGILPAQNFNLKANIHNSNNELVETIYSENIVSLAPSQITEPVFPKWSPAEVGVYTVTYETNSTETDPTPENNSLITSMDITNDVYARDNGEVVGSLGIGVGNGYLGQSFTINEEIYAESGTITFTRGYAGRDYKLALWDTDGSGEPNIIIAETELKTYINDDGFTDTLSFENGPQILIPGRYVLTAVEIDSTLAVAQTSKQFTPGTTFVDWTANPISGWGNNEDYGPGFQKAYAIRLNLGKGIEPDENNILYVDKNVTGGDEIGNSWENAIPELADALKWAKQNESEWTAADPLKIWVADGTYKPMYSPADDNFGNHAGRSNTFLIVKNVQLYGGFAGGETTLEERDWKINLAILNGDIDNTPNDNSQNAYHVVASTGNVESARLDGFRIIGGKADNIATEIVNGISLGHVDGGGINIVNSSPSLANLVVSNNYADTYGGGISQTGSSSLTNVEISNNTGRFGGGIFNYTSTSTFTNVLISNNTSINDGGGIFNYSSSPMFTNVTITNNTASAYGGGIFNYDSPFTAQNSILYGNKLNDDTISNLFVSSSTNYTFKNSLVEGSGGSDVWNSDFGTDLGGNIDLAPLFIDPENANFSLQAYSPAVNSGNNSLFDGLNEDTLDLAGNSRLFGTNIDMGAYEFQDAVISPDENKILYVNQNVSGGNQTGDSWENAIPELADALKWAKENESEWTSADPLKIWVAEGNYKPMYSPADNNFGNPDGRHNSFLMVENVQLYGGFEGNETTLEARDWNVNETILSADIDNTPEDNSGNAAHVVLSANNVDSSSMDGFRITGGNADLNEVISVNSLSIYGGNGGGIYNYDSSFSIANTIVSDNSSSSSGGGIYNYNASVSMNNLTISNNASVIGGGIYNNLSSQSITNSNISNNTSVTAAEGGIYNRFNTISITNTKISENAGRGIVNVSSSLTIVNSTVTNNPEIGIYNDSSSPKIYNSIIYGNQINIFNSNNSVPDVQNSLIGGIDENNEFGNISGDPLFTDPANGDFSLQACSPAVNSGNNSLFDGLDENTLDIAGNPRLFGVNIDMGAYEFQDEQIDYSLVTFEDVTETYDGNEHSIEVANLPEGTTVAYEITNENQTTTTGNSATDAGVYEITATISGCGEPVEYNAVLTINKAQAVITADNTQTHNYDGSMHLIVASLNHLEAALNYSPQQGYINAGTYPITVSAEETDNYLEVSRNVSLIIENADWDTGGGSGVSLPDETYTYNGTAQSVEVENLPQDANATYTITDSEENTESGNSAINAGIYTVTAHLTRPNYDDLELTATLTINKAEAIITSNEVQTHTYDGTLKNVVASLNHNETTLVYSPQQGYTETGTYEIEISAIETQNYLAASKTIDLVIENADFDGIEFEDGEFTYDGIAHSIFVSGEPENATVTYTNNGQINAGTYTVSALIQMPNYKDLELEAELIINKAQAIITSNDVQTHVYDGTVKNTIASLNHAETVLVYAPQQGYTDAGTYAITISALETQNYLAASKIIDLIIENADFDGIEFEDGEFTYDGIAHSIFVSGELENATVTYTNNGQINAGTYTVSALIQMPNYNDLTLTADLIINKAEAIITSNDVQTHTYDGTLKNTVASLNHSETTLVYSPQQGYTDAGTYPITISAVETQNYLAASKTINLVIENADFEGIEFEDGEFTYDGIAHSIFVSGAPTNATVTYTGNGQINAGTYTVSALLQMPNYNDLTLTADLIINKAEAIITSNDVQTHTYDGTVKNTVATLNHVETVLVYSPQQGYTNSGTYPITISAIETQNYLSASKTIDLVIENADFEGIEFEDGEFTYDGIAHSIFVSGEPTNATITYTNNGQTNAGTYTVSALIQIPNYNDLTLTAELIINKAEAIITANDVQTHTYDETVKNVVASLNHSETALVYAPQQGYTNAGTYTITISAIETQNYLSASKTIDLVIENADIEGIEFEDGEFTYDGIAHSIFVSGEPENATVTYTNNGQINAGTYTVSALIQMPNYNDLELEADLIINKAEAIITANDVQTHVYDGTVKNTVASLNHSETSLVYSPQQGYTDAGTYAITISAIETQNYLATSKTIDLVIENADIDGIEFEDGEFTYDGIAHSIFVSGEPENATVTYTNNSQINAGTYTVSALIQMPNYNDLTLTAELIINKASQTLTFNPIPVKHLENDVDFQLDALASSGLEVYYTFTFDTENPAATVTPSGWVELLTSGSIWITAHQDGNENYNPAVSVERELEIVSSNNSIISINIHGEIFENPGNEIYYLIDCGDTSTSINVEIETETGATVYPGHNFSIDVPAPGIYYQTVTVTSQNGSARIYEIIIEKRFNFNDIVVQKFDNVLLVNNNPENNGGYEFDAYEWYKNGALIGTGQYYSAGDNSNDTLDPNAVYHVRMRTTDGEWLSTCQAQIELRAAYSVKIAPNPVYSGNVIKIFADFPEDEMKNMSIKLFSMAGELILETRSSERITEIRLPGGMTSASYVVQINTGKTIKNIQFLVK